MHLTVDINYGLRRLVKRVMAGRTHDDANWEESKHPRGKPENKGEFAKKGEQVAATPKPAEASTTAPAQPAGSAYMPSTREHAQKIGLSPKDFSSDALIKSLGLLLPSWKAKTDRKARIAIKAELLVRGIIPPKDASSPYKPKGQAAPKVAETPPPASTTESTSKPKLPKEAAAMLINANKMVNNPHLYFLSDMQALLEQMGSVDGGGHDEVFYKMYKNLHAVVQGKKDENLAPPAPSGPTENDIPKDKPPLTPEENKLFDAYQKAKNTPNAPEALAAYLKNVGLWYVKSWAVQAPKNYSTAAEMGTIYSAIPNSLLNTEWAEKLYQAWMVKQDEETAQSKPVEAKTPAQSMPTAKTEEKTEETPLSLPLPNEQSDLQKKLYSTASVTTKSSAEKVKAIQAESVHYGGYAEKYKNELIKALGGASEEPAPAPKPDDNAIHPPETSKFYQRAIMARKGARELYGVKDDDAAKIVPSLKKDFWNQVDPLARSTIQSYTGIYYQTINNALRNWDQDVPSDVAEQIDAVDELFESDKAKCTTDMVLHRGEDVPGNVIDKWASALAKGLPCRYSKSGFVSTSLGSSAAMSNKNTQFDIVARKGTPTLGIDSISNNQGENEVLMRHGQTFEVYEIKRTPDKTYVKMVTI